jgi:hypothetical protein
MMFITTPPPCNCGPMAFEAQFFGSPTLFRQTVTKPIKRKTQRRNTFALFDDLFAPFALVPRRTQKKPTVFNSPFFRQDQDSQLQFERSVFRNLDEELLAIARRPKTSKFGIGKENVDPNWSQNQKLIPKKPAPAEPIPNYKESGPMTTASRFESQSVSKNGNKTTVNKKTLLANGNVDSFATKIFEDKPGNRKITELTPEAHGLAVESILTDDEVLREVTPFDVTAIEEEKFRTPEKSQSKSFDKRIRKSSTAMSESNCSGNMFSPPRSFEDRIRESSTAMNESYCNENMFSSIRF